MGLREIAAQDLRTILNDVNGFSWPIKLTNPSGLIKSLNGFSNDIAQAIDPDTGLIVTGRTATIAISEADMLALGFKQLPDAIADTSKKPWLVEFDNLNGKTNKFKITESAPDGTLGNIVCLLSTYKT